MGGGGSHETPSTLGIHRPPDTVKEWTGAPISERMERFGKVRNDRGARKWRQESNLIRPEPREAANHIRTQAGAPIPTRRQERTVPAPMRPGACTRHAAATNRQRYTLPNRHHRRGVVEKPSARAEWPIFIQNETGAGLGAQRKPSARRSELGGRKEADAGRKTWFGYRSPRTILLPKGRGVPTAIKFVRQVGGKCAQKST